MIVREYQEYVNSVHEVLEESIQALRSTSARLDNGEVELRNAKISEKVRMLQYECALWLQKHGRQQ